MSVAGKTVRLTRELIATRSFQRSLVIRTRVAVAVITLHSDGWLWQNSKWPIGWAVSPPVGMKAAGASVAAWLPVPTSIPARIPKIRNVPIRITLSPYGEHYDIASFIQG